MARRRNAGQQVIIDAARREFAEQGYGAASIRNIADRADLSLSALYYYYRGKQDLLAAILDEDFAAYFEACDKALATAGTSAAEQLSALVAGTVRFRSEHPSKSSVVLTESRSLNEEHMARYRETAKRASDRFSQIIAEGTASGEFRTQFPEDARRAVIAMCNAISQWYEADGSLSVDELTQRYIRLALTIVEYQPAPEGRP